MHLPTLIIITGRSGSGKTTLAHELSRKLYLPVVSRDELKEGYVHTFNIPHSELPPQANTDVFTIFFQTINSLLSNSISLIAEAAFQHRVWQPEILPLIGRAIVHLLICKPDEHISSSRYVKRGLLDPKREFFHGDKGVDAARKGITMDIPPYEEPVLDVPTHYIDTSDGYKPSIDEIEKLLFP
jgi:hypothetical protein